MPILGPNPTLADFQRYVAAMLVERGWDKNTILEEALLMGEEVGELFKAIRKSEQLHVDPSSKVGNPGEELADVFIYLCSLANYLKVDLESAVRAKEEINSKRQWDKRRG